MIAKTLDQVNKWIDVKMGVLGSIFMGSWVFWINYEHGLMETSIAAMKQGLYTLFFGGLFVKMAENIAISIDSQWRAILYGGSVPMLITSALTFGLHSMKGTPEPFHSTIPTMIFSLMSFCCWSWYKRKNR